MTTVKATTAKGRALLDRATRYMGYRLSDVYGRVSRAKELAYAECMTKCYEENGYSFRICGYCTTNFSVSWRVENGWRLETYRNSYLILDEE